METNKIMHISQIAIMAAIMVLLSSIPGIPLGPAPIVLENLGVMLAGLLLGAKRGTLAVFLFILLKVIGLSGSGGLALLVGPTCGYVYGWIFTPFFMMLGLRLCRKYLNLWVDFIIIAVVNIIVVDLIGGSFGLTMVSHLPVLKAMIYNCLFIPGDALKAFLAAMIYHQVFKSSHFSNLLK